MTELQEQSRGEWISVEDRLPQNRDAVSIYIDGQFTLGNYTREPGAGCWYIQRCPLYKDYQVTHWMPLNNREGQDGMDKR